MTWYHVIKKLQCDLVPCYKEVAVWFGTLFSQIKETVSIGWMMSARYWEWSTRSWSTHSLQTYNGGGWSLHSEAIVGSMHICNRMILINSFIIRWRTISLPFFTLNYSGCLFTSFLLSLIVPYHHLKLVRIFSPNPGWAFFWTKG